jgi:hypothetical protein|tara:strand:+ start:1469 stop:2290 length:822 start_codon:yes stop_codon:yes gene_type:complete
MTVVYPGFEKRSIREPEAMDFLQVIDPEGNAVFVRISRHEDMGFQFIQVAGDGEIIATAQIGGLVIADPATRPAAPGGTTGLIQIDFMEPARQNRLYHVRPYVIVVRRPDSEAPVASNIFDGTMLAQEDTPPGAMLIWELPVGVRKGGTDKSTQNITTQNLITVSPGGVNSGKIPANMLHLLNDVNHGFDISFWISFGTYISLGLENWCVQRNFGSTNGGNANDDDYDWYIALAGRKFSVVPVKDWELEMLVKGEMCFQSAMLGGVPAITTRA